MASSLDNTYRALFDNRHQLDSHNEQMFNKKCRYKRKRPPSPIQTESSNKRFASEEIVTANLRDLNLSPSPPPSHTHPLIVTAISECPGLSRANEFSTRGSSPLELIDDESCVVRGNQCPPVCPVRAQPSSWSSTLANHELLIDCDMMEQPDSPLVSEEESSQLTSNTRRDWKCWDNTIVDNCSDNETNCHNAPERPLSVWVAPELLKCSQGRNTLPQSLLDKYTEAPGREVVLWVDPSTRFTGNKANQDDEFSEHELMDS